MKKHLFTLLILIFTAPSWAQYNNVETFTTANGLGNSSCKALLLESDGTLWVAHEFVSNTSYNNAVPISRRLPNGTWDYPFTTLGLPAITVGAHAYNWINFSASKIYQSSNGSIWFIDASPATDMNNAPPVLKYDNGNFSAFHISLANFPNKGAVLTMVEDALGNLWFGCQDGLIKQDAVTGLFSTYTPPVVNYGASAGTHNATNVFDLDYDANNKIVMLTGVVSNLVANSSLMRIFTPATNTWEYWTHLDAPWKDATRAFYAPSDLIATRDANNRIYTSSDGGGLYEVVNSDWSSDSLIQIADFLRGWSYGLFSFDNIYTNLPDFTERVFLDNENELWLFASSVGEINAYKKMYETPTNFGLSLATYHLFGSKKSQHLYNNNGSMAHSQYQDMVFSDEGEIWIGSKHGLEHWYLDSLNPPGDYIGLEGVGPKKQGAVGFNTKTSNVVEPLGTGHKMPTSWPDISIDTAYYYLASSDYENLVPGQSAGITGTGVYQGFASTAAALTAAGLDFSDLKLRFSAVGLEHDKRGTNWDWNDPIETRTYQTWFEINGGDVDPMSFYELVLNGDVLFKGQMPDLHLQINYNRYGYLFDSIGAYTDKTTLTPNPNLTSPSGRVIRDSILSDLDGKGMYFVFRTIQTALNEEIRTADRRGGIYRIFDAYLAKDTATAPPVPPTPMCGVYSIGPRVNDDYNSFSAAAADLEARGIVCDVTFQVTKGSYIEQVDLGRVEGMEFYTITFDGLGANPSLKYAPSRADSNYVFRVNTTQNLKFKDIRFQNTGVNYGGVFLLQGTTQNVTLDNCELEGVANAANTPAATANNLILFSCADCDSLLIENCKFIAGADGLKSGGSVLYIRNNEFSENTRIAVDLSGASGIEVTENLILGSSGTFSGIKFGNHPFKINRNQIINSTGNCSYAIGTTNNDLGLLGSPSQIWNNEISIQSLSGSNAALNAAAGNVKVYHNSIKVSGNNANYAALDNFYMTLGWEARNNLIVNENGYCASLSTLGAPAAFPNADYNIYYSNSANPFRVVNGAAATNQANLAAFQGATSVDANSLFIDPQFADDQQLLVMNAAAKDGAILLADLTNDILNRARPNVNRDHGCYEFDGKGWLGAIDNDWNNPGNWSDNAVPNAAAKVFVSPRVNNPRIDAAVEVEEFMMHRNANLTILPGAGLKVNTLLSTSGAIVLETDATGKYGQLIQGTVQGNPTLTQMALLEAPDPSVRWFHLGVPMRTKIADLANSGTHIVAGRAGASIYAWDAAAGNWVTPSDTGAYIEPGQGYAIAAGENASGKFLVNAFPGIISYQGDLTSATALKTASLGYTNVPSFNSYVSAITDGWNLLANPYHAVYDMKDQTLPGSYKTIYVWNGSSYKQYNAQLDVGDSQARYLAPMQGFFIRTDSQSQSFSFDPAKRIISTGSLSLKTQSLATFSLQVSGGSQAQKDNCYFVIHPQAGAQFEEAYDAVKLKNATDHLNFYSLTSSENLAINSLNIKDLMQGVGLGFSAPEDSVFSISLQVNSGFPYQVFLRDEMLNIDHRLDLQDYQFSHLVSNIEGRFFLYLRANEIGQAEMGMNEIFWTLKEGSLLFANLPEEALTFRVMNVQGQEIYYSEKEGGTTEHLLSPQTSNSYDFLIVKIEELGRSFKVVLN